MGSVVRTWLWQLRARLNFSIALSPSNFCAGKRVFHDGKVIVDFEDGCSSVLSDGSAVFFHNGNVVFHDVDVEFVHNGNVVFLNDETDVFLNHDIDVFLHYGNVLFSYDEHVFFSYDEYVFFSYDRHVFFFYDGSVVYVLDALKFFITHYGDVCFIIYVRIQPAFYHYSNNSHNYKSNGNTFIEHGGAAVFYGCNIQSSFERRNVQPAPNAGHQCFPVSAAGYHYNNILV
ncbi:hypothetical protein W97_06117 [Coniosporium apollinis CBS 100218]|uniref:Uncharacterized protein n=1 Tax=Coniosporium apollinis (strain CBS 100218) TaxID=1168221 RepID=R7YZA5_CONA1|nr:uncharacterized protein W97_06117 [Coniosporium apollinis CBS 100218]EON67001.1 hypothetical protein W97_06117 [Coniosporium apollinis CBS 100218]